MVRNTPMAFLLVRFRGSNDEPITRADADQMFTAAGRETMNIVDWFDDNTHGNINMAGNQVFGWLELSETINDYCANRGNRPRTHIIDLGRNAATAARIDLSNFTNVVVVTNIDVDFFGVDGGDICCTVANTAGVCEGVNRNLQWWESRWAPSTLCQEIIHGLGIGDHTRRHGSDDNYTDPYDVMSMFTNYQNVGRHPNNPNLPVGPGLNAAFMQRCGWLDITRGASIGQVNLRPLHRRDLPGSLYAKVGEYYVEYRPSRRWDTGFSSIVLVHYIAKNTSYLVAELRAGDQFSWGDPNSLFEEHGSITVNAIDDGAEAATFTTSYRPIMSTKHSGYMIQSTFGNKGNFEVAVPSSTGLGFAFAWRNNDASGYPWAWSPAARILAQDDPTFGRYSDIEVLSHMSLIQGNFGSNLELLAHVLVDYARDHSGEVRRVTNYWLAHYWRDGAGTWRSDKVMDAGLIYDPLLNQYAGPAMIQSTFGNKGNFEVVVPLKQGGFTHLWRNNYRANLPWTRSGDFFTGIGRIEAITLIQSDYGRPGILEVVARIGNQLAHFWRDSGPAFNWRGPNFFFTGAAGIPGFIQGSYGNTRRNFEVVTPLESGGIAHLYRDNANSNLPWSGPSRGGVFGQELGLVDSVALIQGNYGRNSNYPGNMEVVAKSRGILYHFFRNESFGWFGTGSLPPIP